ncbi:hypothetical protein L1080_033810 [Rhodococcus sp. MSC1_016]|jgi:hypothetical protein|uniref:hypothetical protein n=1 Tax=Rhodococcus sp. MSC1_016 TaxID=2909266 RepID=UPI0020308060|nr:hypothetical protein [Rhodococcus sp. MSC1_016]
MRSKRHLDQDILDLAILWAPLGGPPADRVSRAFGLGMSEYRQRLPLIVRFHHQQPTTTSHASPEPVYAKSVLDGLVPLFT